MNKQYLLTGLDYLYDLKPSKWNEAVTTKFKWKFLPKLIEAISCLPDDWVSKLDDKSNIRKEVPKEVTSEDGKEVFGVQGGL